VRPRNAFLLFGVVVVAHPPACVAQTDSTPVPTDSITGPTHPYFIDAARLTRERAVRDVGELLMDRVPGLHITPGSGLTGMGSRIRLRGVQSLLDDRAPLVLVDGMRVDQAEDDYWALMAGPVAPGPLRLSDLNVADLESVQVVEPAEAAVYGPGAAGGVILIHTKRGRLGPARWEAYAAGGVRSESAAWPANFGGVDIDSPDSLYRHGGCTLLAQTTGRCVQDFVQQFNPLAQRSPFRLALARQYGLSVSGGSSRADYRLTGDFSGSDGPFASSVVTPDPNYYRRVNLRGSGAVRPWPSLEIVGSLARVSSDLNLPPDILSIAVYGSSDSTNFSWGPSFRLKNSQAVSRIYGSLDARWVPWTWLALHGLAGWDAVALRDAAAFPYSSAMPNLLGSSVDAGTQRRHRTLTLEGTVTHALSSRIRSTTTLGVQHLRDSLDQSWTASLDTGSGFPVCRACAGGGRAEWQRSLGYYAAERLEFGRRLSVTGAVRHDHFRELDRSMTHPSVAVSWVARDTDASMVNLVRLRAAYGSAGRAFPMSLPLVLLPTFTPLPPIELERTKSFEIGADASFVGRRMDAQLTYYDMRSDVLQSEYVNGSSGYFQVYGSGSTISNRGIEALLLARILAAPRLGWDVALSLWGNRNRLIELYGVGQCFGTTGVQCLKVGYPVGGYWPIPLNYADANGDGIISPSEVTRGPDRVWAGTPYPTQGAMLTSGWTLASTVKVSVTLDYRAGQSLFNLAAWWRCTSGTCRQANDPRTPVAEQAQTLAQSGPSPAYIEDADYLKLRELAVTVFAPPSIAAALRATTATITLAGRDLATWTGYSGVDPEAGSYGTVLPGPGRSIEDFTTMPLPHSWTLRVNLVF
jgi:TonB-dependent starch-binding outer membrane protein SusC